MQRLSRRVLTRTGLLDIVCQSSVCVQAAVSQSPILSVKSAAENNAYQTLTQRFSTSCKKAPAAPAASSLNRCCQSDQGFVCSGLKRIARTRNYICRCPKSFGPHKGDRATLATKAEEYDLIVAEAGLVRIEGYVLLLQLSVTCHLLTPAAFFSGMMKQASL